MDAALSDQDKLAIVRHLVLSAPDAELSVVLQDLRAMIPADSAFLDEHLPAVLVDYHKEHLSIVRLSDDTKLVLSAFNALGGTEFADVAGKRAVTINPFSLEAVSTRPLEESELPDSSVEATRADLEAEVTKYARVSYPQGAAGVYVTNAGGAPVIKVCISNVSQDFANFCTGKWRAVWTVNVATGAVHGVVRSQAHYFEKGNVQLASKQEYDTDMPSVTGAEFVKYISEREASFQADVDEACGVQLTSTFKALRRRLPMRGTKFDFDTFGHRMLGELNRMAPSS